MLVGCGMASRLQDVAGQVLVLHQLAQVLVDVLLVDGDADAVLVGRFIRQRFEQPLQHRVQATRADVFGALVHLVRDFGDATHAARRRTRA